MFMTHFKSFFIMETNRFLDKETTRHSVFQGIENPKEYIVINVMFLQT